MWSMHVSIPGSPFDAQNCISILDMMEQSCATNIRLSYIWGVRRCAVIEMTRKYELRRRAERQEQTRHGIVEAAITLHRTKGPSRTTLSDVARLAGVQRHTLYRHFPDERALGLACSGRYMDEHPLPDPTPWVAITDQAKRRRVGLTALYTWYSDNQEMLSAVLRDAEIDPTTGEMFQLRAGETMARMREVLAIGLSRRKRPQAMLDVALDFYTWRRLARSGLSPAQATDAILTAL
jgi:AcrR family transcriptional regulator